jgi:hypothetical protein
VTTKWLVALVLSAALASATGSAEESPPTPFEQVNGDGWITSNAHFDGKTWTARLATRPSFGLQLGEENDIPFEHGTAGATFWERDAGCSGPFASFGKACGWKLGLAITQFRSLVVGGNGIEIDGLGLDPPYGRLVSVSDGSARRFGLTSNVFADWSGADVAAAPRWFAGFNLSADRFEIDRSLSMSLAPLVTVAADGSIASSALATARVEQTLPEAFATRARMVDGQYVFVFRHAYAHIPVCVASSEGTAPVHVRSTPSACTIISATPADTSMINVQITGDPN